MSTKLEDLQRAVATKPLDEACHYIIYALKSEIVTAQTALKVVMEPGYSQRQQEEAQEIAAQSLAQTLQTINNVIIDVFLPRLHQEE